MLGALGDSWWVVSRQNNADGLLFVAVTTVVAESVNDSGLAQGLGHHGQVIGGDGIYLTCPYFEPDILMVTNETEASGT